MATYDFSTTAQEISEAALRILGVTPLGATVSTAELNNARYALNILIKRVSVDGSRMWKLEEHNYSIPIPSTVLGTDGSYYFAIDNHTSTVNDIPASGANYTDKWNIGADTTATAWSAGTAYTTAHIISISGDYWGVDKAFYRENSVDYPLSILPYQAYYAIDDKFVRCTVPSHISHNVADNRIYIYPYPYTATGRVHLLLTRYIADIDANSDNPDFPVEWMEALTYMLAFRLADEYQKSLDERSWLKGRAQELYREALASDNNSGSTMTVQGGYSSWRK